MKTETDKYWELFEEKKSQRSACGNQDNDWKHDMITYASLNRKECTYCEYWEDIEVNYD